VAGESNLSEAREAIVGATRQYAKRQMTWFRKQTPAEWFEIDSADDTEREALGARVLTYVRRRLDELGRGGDAGGE
jgi:tRNA dimethylallyltransferase